MSRITTRVTHILLAMILLGNPAYAGAIANRNPTGELFPRTVGQSLTKESLELPAEFSGSPAVLLIGYEQDTQLDIDQWILSLKQAGLQARIMEIPTMPGTFAKLAAGMIDNGMREGIPEEDWEIVLTLYGKSAKRVAEFTGTTNGHLARVIVLNSEGKVAWFNDTGYAPGMEENIVELIRELSP